GEDVAQVGAAGAADHLGADHAVGAIGALVHVLGVDWLVEAGPAGAGLELGLGVEERLAAADAAVRAIVVAVPVLAREGSLGARPARDLVLLVGQLLTPLLIGLVHLGVHISKSQRTALRYARRPCRRTPRSRPSWPPGRSTAPSRATWGSSWCRSMTRRSTGAWRWIAGTCIPAATSTAVGGWRSPTRSRPGAPSATCPPTRTSPRWSSRPTCSPPGGPATCSRPSGGRCTWAVAPRCGRSGCAGATGASPSSPAPRWSSTARGDRSAAWTRRPRRSGWRRGRRRWTETSASRRARRDWWCSRTEAGAAATARATAWSRGSCTRPGSPPCSWTC